VHDTLVIVFRKKLDTKEREAALYMCHLGRECLTSADERLQTQAEGPASQELKPCSRCGVIRKVSAFFDKSLTNGEVAMAAFA
jgi:hypothetical protein